MRYEQIVYGSFPFWDKGYAVLAHSPGCLPEWRDAFQSACQKLGERPRGATDPFPGSMFTVRGLAGQNVWAIIGVSTPGADDRGRPDALAFHGLIVKDREFRKIGYDPFLLSPCLRRDWSPATTLDEGKCEPDCSPSAITPEASRIAALLKGGKKVAIETAAPLDGFARSVWAALPSSCRRKLTMATWTFANDLRLNLLAAPNLETLDLDSSYVRSTLADLATHETVIPREASTRFRPSWRVRVKSVALAVAALALAGFAIARVPRRAEVIPNEPIAARSPVEPSRDRSPAPPSGAPDLALYRDEFEDPAEALAVERGLAMIGKRFLGLEPDATSGPTAWMQAIAALRYEGGWLSPHELAEIRNGSSPGRSRALANDALIRHFANDRPLPAGFASGPLRWQLDTLAWSFHLDLAPRLTAAEIPSAIAESLSVDEVVVNNPLEATYPALADYAEFLRRLPRRP